MSGRREVSAAEIAEAIAKSRARLAHTLAVLDREYALRHLFVRGTRMLRRHGDPGGATLAERMRGDILPVAVLGIGLAWLTLVGRRDGAQLGRRLIEGVTHLQALARALVAFVAAPPGDGSEHGEASAAAPPDHPPNPASKLTPDS
jgi:hypothetical protein